MTSGAPHRSRDELAALGKKRLEDFRQRKLRKALELQQVGGGGGGVQMSRSTIRQATAGRELLLSRRPGGIERARSL